MKIKNMVVHKVGNNHFIRYGQLENGNYFKADDSDDAFIELYDVDISDGEKRHPDFYVQHQIGVLTGNNLRLFYNEMLRFRLETCGIVIPEQTKGFQ